MGRVKVMAILAMLIDVWEIWKRPTSYTAYCSKLPKRSETNP